MMVLEASLQGRGGLLFECWVHVTSERKVAWRSWPSDCRRVPISKALADADLLLIA